MNSILDCTVVILSYNSKQVTDTCLTKLETATAYSHQLLGNTVKVIVVDNASSDGSVDMIKQLHPTVELIAMSTNVGYAQGNNIAMKMAQTPLILLMNSDTYVYPESIAKIIQAIASRPDCDALGCRHLCTDGKQQRTGGFTPTPLKLILWTLGFESLPGIKYLLPRIYGYNPWFYSGERQVGWYAPNFFLIRRRVFDQTDGFDNSLFFHMVDIEWCHRIHQQGLTIRYTPTIDVIHLGGASSRDLEAKLFMDNFKGLFHYCQKHYPKNAKLLSAILRFGLRIRSFFYSFIGKSQMAAIYKDAANIL